MPVSGSLPQYIFQKENTSWSSTNVLAGKIASFVSNVKKTRFAVFFAACLLVLCQ